MRASRSAAADIGQLLGDERVDEVLAVDLEQDVGTALEIEAQGHRPREWCVSRRFFCMSGGKDIGQREDRCRPAPTPGSR